MSEWNSSQYDSSNAGFGGNNDGGFGASQSPMVGKTPQTGNRNPSDVNLLPVTIKLLNDAQTSEDNSTKTVNGRPLSSIKICGRVCAVDAKATYTCYTLDDSTGMMEVRQWKDDDENAESVNKIAENDYVSVVGKVSIFNNNCQINCYNVIKCKSYNEVIHHLISVVYCNEMNKKNAGACPAPQIALGAPTSTGGQNAGTGEEDTLADEMAQWNDTQRKVYQAIRETQSSHENGVYTPDLVGRLGMSQDSLRECLAFLTNEGMIYDTTSEEWVRTTADN